MTKNIQDVPTPLTDAAGAFMDGGENYVTREFARQLERQMIAQVEWYNDAREVLRLAAKIYVAAIMAGNLNIDTDRCVELALALMKKSREEAEKL